MSGADGTNETSTVNGYVATKNGNPLAASAMGGPARKLSPPNDRFHTTTDSQMSGFGTDLTVAVGFVPIGLTQRALINAVLSGPGVPAWMWILEGAAHDELWFYGGDGGGSFNKIQVATGITPGVPHLAWASGHQAGGVWRIFLDGVFIASFASGLWVGPGALDFWIGGWSGGLGFEGFITVPTGWDAAKSDADAVAFWNGGTPFRLP